MALPGEAYLQLTPDLRICRVLTGMWQVSGAHGRIDPAAAVAAMVVYHDAGYTTWDLADHYGPAEDLLGAFRRRLARPACGLNKETDQPCCNGPLPARRAGPSWPRLPRPRRTGRGAAPGARGRAPSAADGWLTEDALAEARAEAAAPAPLVGIEAVPGAPAAPAEAAGP